MPGLMSGIWKRDSQLPRQISTLPEAGREGGRRLFKPQTVLLRWKGLRGGGSNLAMARHLVQEWY